MKKDLPAENLTNPPPRSPIIVITGQLRHAGLNHQISFLRRPTKPVMLANIFELDKQVFGGKLGLIRALDVTGSADRQQDIAMQPMLAKLRNPATPNP